MTNKKLYILGASGHGQVVLSILRALNLQVSGFYDDAPDLWGTFISGVPVHGSLADFINGQDVQALIALGNNDLRKKIVNLHASETWFTAIHPAAWVDPSVHLGPGTIVCAGAVLQTQAQIGAHCIINTSASVDHHCIIEDFVHICPGVHLGGNVRIGARSWIGIGSQVIQNIDIGENVLVGAGSTIVTNIPDNAVVMGTPGRIVRYQS